MPTLKIAHVSTIAMFALGRSRKECEASMLRFERKGDDSHELAPEILSKMVARFDFELQRVLREQRLKGASSLRIGDGYGWPEYHKNWLRLGCEFLVEDHELASALSVLSDPMFLGVLDSRFEEAGFDFSEQDLDPELFDEVTSSVLMYESPENA